MGKVQGDDVGDVLSDAEMAALAAQGQHGHLNDDDAGETSEAGQSTSVRELRPLTSQMITFANGVIQGKTKRQAYRDAYPNAKGTDQTISTAAHKLASDPRIQKLITSAWEQTTEALADDVASTKRYVLHSLIALSKTGKQEGSRLKALELLGRAAGMWQAQAPADDKPVSAEQLKRDIAAHLKLIGGKAV